MGMQISSTLSHFWGFKCHHFLLKGMLRPLVLLSCPESLGLWSQASRDKPLRRKPRVRVRAQVPAGQICLRWAELCGGLS